MYCMKKLLILGLLFALPNLFLFSQQLEYPFSVHSLTLRLEGKDYNMAFMDVQPAKANGEVVILLHGKNFNGYYWKDVIPSLTKKGFRVIVPDQIGWGKSDKPPIHYSFHMLANNTKQLLDTLGVKKANVVAHSMGGMLATRFAVMYPQIVSKLVLENPIGLEDYSRFVPYKKLDELFENEEKTTYESTKKYQQSYYPVWKPEYEQYVKAQHEAFTNGDQKTNALVNALTYQVIYEQPVVYEFENIKAPTLLIIGQEDRTVVGKNLLNEQQKKQYGNYPALGRSTKAKIKNAKLVELPGVGHIPHIQVLPLYIKHLLTFLESK